MGNTRRTLAVLEVCAGAGGQALGLEAAGFEMAAAIDNDRAACETLQRNRPGWTVRVEDIRDVSGRAFRGVDLFAAGVPCPPFSIAGDQLGHRDERDLFPEALRLIGEARPRAVVLENVRGFAAARFADYRSRLQRQLVALGYESQWRILNASDYGVPQLRPRFLLVALRPADSARFRWPEPAVITPPTVGEVLQDLMAARGWKGAKKWAVHANTIAPTIVGGSKKHGGPDLGPTRARRQWAALGVDGIGIADEPPGAREPVGHVPKLTVRMAARIQGFPDSWIVSGRKTAAYRQVGNAFPPPVAHVIGESIRAALESRTTRKASDQDVKTSP